MKFSIRIVQLCIIFLCLCKPVFADNQSFTSVSGKQTVALDFGLAAGFITSWGISRWGWFQHSPTTKREGWFGKDTHAGGADKTGHFYMSYVLSDMLLWDFRRNGVSNPERTAALTALAAMTVLEIGDATSSKYGFSYEDFVADAGGVLASWWLAKNPQIDRLLDIRMEYWPSEGFSIEDDAASDYTGMKHLLAFRGDAINRFDHTPLRWLELQAGYYTRGFRSYDTPLDNGPERHLFVGLGLSLPALLKKNKTAQTLATYLQIPQLQSHHSWKF